MIAKICNTCGESKPIEAFEYRKDTNKYRNDCKQCKQQYLNKYRRETDDYKKKYNEYRKQRRQTDIQYQIMDRMRARIRKCLKAKDISKYTGTMEILGCSFDYLKSHFEKLFYGDMSWEKRNFEIDHRVPISWFDLSNPKHFKYCFSYKNLQPLTPQDNAKKKDKVHVDYDLSKNPYI